MDNEPSRIQQALDQQEAELSLLRCLLLSMIRSFPIEQQSKIHKDFEKYSLLYLEQAPENISSELLIEIRARLAFYLQSILQ